MIDIFSFFFKFSILAVTVLSIFIWSFRSKLYKRPSFSQLSSSTPLPRALLLVTAHPDDESMFFIPTLEALRRSGACSDTHILCCSTGNSEGRGSVRAGELVNAAKVLGIQEKNVAVLDHFALRDGMLEKWDSSAVSAAVRASVRKIIDTQRVARKDHSSSLGVCIVSFDIHGVSGHPNHSAVFKGIDEFLQGSADTGQFLSSNLIICYKLETVFPLRKFLSIFDVGISFLVHLIRLLFTLWGNFLVHGSTSSLDSIRKEWPDFLFLIGGGIKLTHSAMFEHVSQYVWWRRLFVVFSRYTFVNTLSRIKVVEARNSNKNL